MNFKALLIEDDPIISDMLKQKLEESGNYVVIAETGQDALNALVKNEFDIILLDIVLPGMSGFDVLKKIKMNKEIKNIPVLILSNLNKDVNAVKGMRLGAVEYIVKASMSPSALMEKINNIVKTSRK